MYLFKLLLRLTCRKGKFHLHSTMYLFKRQFPVVLSFCCFIYIPPCIYLNNVTEQVKNEVNNIYIPPCIYLNSPDENTIYLIQGDLHSTMYLFKLGTGREQKFCSFYLHSTMYLFKLQYPGTHGSIMEYLHSTMYLFKRRRGLW